MNLEIDHLVFAAADLDHACEIFASECGVRPVRGGPHRGMGTHNALASLEGGAYLEWIAPDPKTATPENLGGALARLENPKLFTWALRSRDLPGVAAALTNRGLQTTPISPVSREAPSGEALVWDLMGMLGVGGAWPFFIDWRDTPHPSASAPMAGRLTRLSATFPDHDLSTVPFRDAPGLVLREGPPRLEAEIETRAGRLSWSTEAPAGFFP